MKPVKNTIETAQERGRYITATEAMELQRQVNQYYSEAIHYRSIYVDWENIRRRMYNDY